jgi:hypothetical protein
MRCAFPLTSVPLHTPRYNGSHYLTKTVGKVGERVTDFLSIITTYTYSTTGCSNVFTFFQSCVVCKTASVV